MPPAPEKNGSAAALPTITIDGKACAFRPGQMILQVANHHGIEIPQYCYHDALSIVASCRICLAEVWAPNPRAENKLEPFPKLVPTCQTAAADGMVVYTDSPKSIANQKAVMEYLLINHPLDCPVCDQSGECLLQDYSYEYGRGVSRFEESKVKQPKKDLGPHVYLYADRCIMCSRCVRFTREVTGTAELLVQGRGNKVEIDIFPGKALDNELSANVIDLCPVGALLDKDFLFAQRVWFLKSTPSIDGITASGDNILIEHNEGRLYRIKPRDNPRINKWWITDEVRYGWKFVHAEHRIREPLRRQFGLAMPSDWRRALADAVAGVRKAISSAGANGSSGGGLAVLVSPMLATEEAYALASLARELDPGAVLGVGPVPVVGHDKVYPPGASPDGANAFIVRAEKAPNARGVRRALEAVAGAGGVPDFAGFLRALASTKPAAAIVTGNYPSEWATRELRDALRGVFVVAIDTLESELSKQADVVLPGATWAEKAGSFVSAAGVIQAFEQAIPTQHAAKSEGQIAFDLLAEHRGEPARHEPPPTRLIDEGPGQVPDAATEAPPRSRRFNAAMVRAEMAEKFPDVLGDFATGVVTPALPALSEPDMEVVEL